MSGDSSALDKLLEKAAGRPLVLDFQYDACGHCQEIAPAFEQIMFDYQGEDAENPDVMFYKVDIYQHKERLAEWGIKKFPTFQIYVKGEKMAQLEGKDKLLNHELELTIDDAVLAYKNEQARQAELAEEAELI